MKVFFLATLAIAVSSVFAGGLDISPFKYRSHDGTNALLGAVKSSKKRAETTRLGGLLKPIPKEDCEKVGKKFKKAQHPYAQKPDGCSGFSDPKQVRDTWGSVSFKKACDRHDRCYYTLGASHLACNDRFLRDLRKACEKGLKNYDGPAGLVMMTRWNPATLTTCYGIAQSYYQVVALAVDPVFWDAQKLQKEYENWVASCRSSLISAKAGR